MIYCPQCGNPNFDDANFCDTCGEPLVSADAYAQIKEQAELAAAVERERQEKQMHAYAKAYDKAKKEAAAAAVAAGAGSGAEFDAAMRAEAASPAGAEAGAEAIPPAAADVTGAVPPSASAPAAGAPASASAPAAGAPATAGAVPPPPHNPSTAAPQTPPTTPPPPPQTPSPQVTVYKHGCVAQAWDDITESPGWGKKMTLLGLINCVPILNFFTFGYAMNWAAQLESDRVEPMPNKILGDGFFLQGFYAFIVILVFSFVGGIASMLVNVVPLLGALVGIVIGIGIQIFYMLSLMRVAISRELGPGFAFADIWQACTTGNQFGKLFCATIVPGLVVGAAIMFICGSIIVLFGLASFSNIINIVQMIDAGYPEYMYTTALVSLIMAIIPLVFICLLVMQFLQVFAIVLALRATSHFIMRYLPSWRSLVKQEVL